MNGLDKESKDYIWSELFQHFNAAFLRNVEEIAHAITDFYCNHKNSVNLVNKSKFFTFIHLNLHISCNVTTHLEFLK